MQSQKLVTTDTNSQTRANQHLQARTHEKEAQMPAASLLAASSFAALVQANNKTLQAGACKPYSGLFISVVPRFSVILLARFWVSCTGCLPKSADLGMPTAEDPGRRFLKGRLQRVWQRMLKVSPGIFTCLPTLAEKELHDAPKGMLLLLHFMDLHGPEPHSCGYNVSSLNSRT